MAQDYAAAASWYQKAADQGHIYAGLMPWDDTANVLPTRRGKLYSCPEPVETFALTTVTNDCFGQNSVEENSSMSQLLFIHDNDMTDYIGPFHLIRPSDRPGAYNVGISGGLKGLKKGTR